MKKLLIFVIFISACSVDKPECYKKPQFCFDMIISDGLPIQFWQNGQQTFNEYKPGYPIIHQCFTQEFQCDDNIKLQLQDSVLLGYFLSLVDDMGDVTAVPFTETVRRIDIVDTDWTTGLDGFTNTSAGDATKNRPWAWSSEISPGGPKATVFKNFATIANTEILKKPVTGLSGNNKVSFKWKLISEGTSSDFTLQLHLFKNGSIVQTVTLEHKTGIVGNYTNEIIDLAFVASSDFDEIGAGVIFNSAATTVGGTVYLYYILDQYITSTSVYDAAFIPEDIGICEKTVQLFMSYGGPSSRLDFTIPSSSLWINNDSDGTHVSWIIGGSDAHVTLSNFTRSKNLSIPISISNFSNVQVQFDVNVTSTSSTNGSAVFRKAGVNCSNLASFACNATVNHISQTFNLTDIPDELIISVLANVPSGGMYTVPQSSVKMFILPGTVVAKSDPIKFSSDITENTLIRYKSEIDFEGLVYPGDGNYFSIRVPGAFYHQSFPTTVKSVDIGNSREINTASLQFRAKELDIQDCPYFMHDKILLVLQHAISGSVVINNVEWSFDNSYDLVDDDPMYIFRRASTKLVRRNRVTRNII